MNFFRQSLVGFKNRVFNVLNIEIKDEEEEDENHNEGKISSSSKKVLIHSNRVKSVVLIFIE